MFKLFKDIIASLLRHIGGALGRKLRFWYYRPQFKSCGKNVIIEEGVFFESPEQMSIGNNVWIDKNTILLAGAFNSKDRLYSEKGSKELQWGELVLHDNVHVAPFSVLQAHGGLRVGANVTVASGSKLYSLSHHYRNLEDKTDSKRYHFSSMAETQDQFMIVGNVIVEEGCAVGLNSVLLPGSYISKGIWLPVGSVVKGMRIESKETAVQSTTHEA